MAVRPHVQTPAPKAPLPWAVPCLKWVGGKRQLLSELLPVLTSAPFHEYHEPFVGGGAVFFALRALGFSQPFHMADVNIDLAMTYEAVKSHLGPLLGELRFLASEHTARSERAREVYFYAVRSVVPAAMVHRAARMIYLNRLCFNGLWRTNTKGLFNVPYGRHVNPTICDEDNLRACSAALKDATITCGDFEVSLSRVQAGDLCYLYSPYVPVNKTSNFVSYGKDGFGPKDQERLAAEFARLTKLGARVVLSNADCDVVRRLYEGHNIRSVSARRNVNSDGAKRGKVGEVIVTNF